MPIRINLKELFDSDSQSITVDKLNFNFNKLLELGIGLPGDEGVTGPQGGVGPAGLQGPIGDDGNYWFVGAGDPNPQTFTDLEDNDFYLDTSNSSIWQYDASINTWNVVVDFAAVINNYLNSLGATFIRGLGAGSPDDNRYILFPNRGNTIPDTVTDGLGGTSNNDILFLSNFNEKLGVINIANFPTNSDNLYNAIQKIYVDSTSGIPGRYHLELGSLYQDTNGTLDNLISSLKTNLKFRHVVDDLGGSSNFPATNNYLYLGKISLSKPELALIGEIDYNAALEIITPKYNNEGAPVVRGEVVTRIGSREALGEYFTGLNIDGLTIDLSGLTGKIAMGIASNFSSIRPEVDGLDYLMLEKDSSIEAIYLNGKTLQNEGNIEQISTGEVSIAESVTNSFTEEQWQYNQGIAIAGNKLITVGGDHSPIDISQNGRINLYNIVNPKKPILEYTRNTSSSTTTLVPGPPPSFVTSRYIFGAGISDVKIAGEYAYFVNNQDGTTAGVSSLSSTCARFQIGKIYNDSTTTESIRRISIINETEARLEGAYRLEVRGSYAWVICNPDYPTNTLNFARLTSVDIANPTVPVVADSYIDTGGTRYISMDVSDGQVAVLKTKVTNPGLTTRNLQVDLLLFDASDPNSITSPTASTDVTNRVFSLTGPTITVSQLPANVGGIRVLGSYAYVVWNKQLLIYDIQLGTGITPIKLSDTSLGISSATFTSIAIDVEILGNTAYVLAFNPGADPNNPGTIIKVDISDPSNPYVISETRLIGLARPGRLKYSGKYLYVVSASMTTPAVASGGLFVIDIDGIRSPGAHIDSIRAGELHVDKHAVIQENLSVNHSLNVGPGGIYVDAGLGIAADGPIGSIHNVSGGIPSGGFSNLMFNVTQPTATSANFNFNINAIKDINVSDQLILNETLILSNTAASEMRGGFVGNRISRLGGVYNYGTASSPIPESFVGSLIALGSSSTDNFYGDIRGTNIILGSGVNAYDTFFGHNVQINAGADFFANDIYGYKFSANPTTAGTVYGIVIDGADKNRISGELDLNGTSPTTPDFRFSNGNLFNFTNSLYNPSGVVYANSGELSLKSGTFVFNGTSPDPDFSGIWTKIGNVVQVQATLVVKPSGGYRMYLPVQPGGGASIVTFRGMSIQAFGTGVGTGRRINFASPDAGELDIALGIPNSGNYQISISYVIG